MAASRPPAEPDAEPDAVADPSRLDPGALGRRMGITFLEASPDRVVARMPVAGNTQPYGLLHGGASVVLAETVGSVGSALHAGADRVAVGVDVNATHHRAATAGHVTATARALTRGGTLTSYEVSVRDDDDRLVCTARITCLLRPRPSAGQP